MKTLFETKGLVIEHSYEYLQLRDKISSERLYTDEFWGDPGCALIDENELWAVVAGDKLVVWTREGVREIKQPGLKSIESIRLKGAGLIEILVDPWSEIAAIWILNVLTLETKKVRDLDDYKDQPYSDSVVW